MVGNQIEASSLIRLEDHRMLASRTTFLQSWEKRVFVPDAPRPAVFARLWLQTMSLRLTADADSVRKRGRGRKSDSHKPLIVLHPRGQKKYGWN